MLPSPLLAVVCAVCFLHVRRSSNATTAVIAARNSHAKKNGIRQPHALSSASSSISCCQKTPPALPHWPPSRDVLKRTTNPRWPLSDFTHVGCGGAVFAADREPLEGSPTAVAGAHAPRWRRSSAGPLPIEPAHIIVTEITIEVLRRLRSALVRTASPDRAHEQPQQKPAVFNTGGGRVRTVKRWSDVDCADA